eukprot:SM000132S26874  [mRNA]  locus=s132:144266:146702:- [translate_table: standard]
MAGAFLYPSEGDTRALLQFLATQLAHAQGAAAAAKPRLRRPLRRQAAAAATPEKAPLPPRLSAAVSEALAHCLQESTSGSTGEPPLPTSAVREAAAVLRDADSSSVGAAAVGAASRTPQHGAVVRTGTQTAVLGRGGCWPPGLLAPDDSYREGLDGASVATSTVAGRPVGDAAAADAETEGLAEADEHEAAAKEAAAQAREAALFLMERAAELLLGTVRRGEAPVEAVAGLRQRLRDGEARRAQLQAEWEALRAPLTAELDELQQEEAAAAGRGARATDRLHETAALLRATKEEEEVLLAELEAVPGAPVAGRGAYVGRIMELVRHLRKQEAVNASILDSVRSVQREANAAADRLAREYALVDELVFRNAKKDNVCRDAYRLLAHMHQSFEALGARAADADRAERQIAELQDELDHLAKRPTDATCLRTDLEAVRAENLELQRQLDKPS